MIDEIQAGLKNAIERGSSLDEAVQSFISAGYNPVEVKEAANSLSPSIAPIMQPKNAKSNSAVQSMNNEQVSKEAMKYFTSGKSPFAPTQGIQPISQPKQTVQQPSPSNTSTPYQLQTPSSTFANKRRKYIIILIIVLVLLITALATVGFFAEEILNILFK